MSATELMWVLVPALGTSLGGMLLIAVRRPSERALDGLAGFAGGIMLAAAAFSLLVPALERGELWGVLPAFALGALAIAGLDGVLPHAHERFAERDHPRPRRGAVDRRGAMLLSAMTIHNVPEGAAVGVALAAGGVELGAPIALAIALQNVPEGFVAATPLISGGMRPRRAAMIGAATGMVEPPAALAAFWALTLSEALLPLGLGFAAAAMLYVVVDELLPECFARGNERIATLSLIAGFALMMGLDTGL